MGNSRFLARGLSFGDRTRRALRAAVETALLLSVAVGCVQAGYTLLTPSKAGATNGADVPPQTPIKQADLRSPFEPDSAGMDAASHAAAALMSTVQLAGVRTSTVPELSGAVLVMADGAQRAYRVGQELMTDVRLDEVGADYVLLSYPGGKRQISMPASEGYSFARAMMGEAQAASPPPNRSPADAPAVAPAVAVTLPTPAEAQAVKPVAQPVPSQGALASGATEWFAAALSHVETAPDGMRGWRVSEPVPEVVAKAGLRAGDLIVSVNGQGPDNPLAVAAAAASGQAQLSVRRGAERITIALARERST